MYKKILNRASLFLMLILVSLPGFNQVNTLFTPTADTGFVVEKFDSMSIGPKMNIRFRPAEITANTNSRLRIFLPRQNQPDGLPVIIKKDSQANRGNEFAWYGKLEHQAGSFVLLTKVNNTIVGHLRTSDNKLYSISYRGNNVNNITLINQNLIKLDVAEAPPINYNAADIDSKLRETAAGCCDSDTIDVMVVYTEAAKRAAGGAEGILSEIIHCRNITNESFRKSNIPARIEIVHHAPVPYSESGSMRQDQATLQEGSHRQLSDVARWRDQYAADIVIMLVQNSGTEETSGWANVMEEVSPGFATQAYCVVWRRAAYNDLIFPHEIGHILGGRHHCRMDWTLTPFPYSHGYHNDVHSTIMAKMPGTLRVEYWSDTAINFPGGREPAGSGVGNCQAIDAEVLRQTISVVSKFRCRVRCGGDRASPAPQPVPDENDEPVTKTNWLLYGMIGLAILILLIWLLTRRRS